MSTISVPLSPHLEEELNKLIQSGYGSNKADVVRRAITRVSEEEAVAVILRASQEVSLSGDLRELSKKFK